VALLPELFDTPKQTHVTDHHTQDDEWWFPLVEQTLDDGKGRAYLARTESVR